MRKSESKARFESARQNKEKRNHGKSERGETIENGKEGDIPRKRKMERDRTRNNMTTRAGTRHSENEREKRDITRKKEKERDTARKHKTTRQRARQKEPDASIIKRTEQERT